MRDGILAFLGNEWSGLAIGGALALLGAIGIASGGAAALAGTLLLLGGLALGAGNLVHLRRLDAARRQFPPRGRLIDIGGYRLHVVAEGKARGRPPIVWLGGSHAAGATMDHVHQALKVDTRSILIDRPGTGWSDTGPFPRTTAREADEIVAALDRAGERGPFVFAGYSFGGLLAANIARRHPDRVATLVLLDPTPLEVIVFGPRLGALKEMRRDALWSALARLAGFEVDFAERRLKRNPAHGSSAQAFETTLGPALAALRGIEIGAGQQLAGYSIYRELSPTGAAACGWETVVYDGDLGDLPVVLVAPGTAGEIGTLPEVADASAREAERMRLFFERARERYLAISTNSRRVVAPPGTTHQFVYERPDFVIETLRGIVAEPVR